MRAIGSWLPAAAMHQAPQTPNLLVRIHRWYHTDCEYVANPPLVIQKNRNVPFTPTHIVAILPLWPLRRWLPFSGLAIGAMVPDIALFFPIVDYAQTHSPLGVFSMCLPFGIALFVLFDTLMRGPLVALLPAWFQTRINPLPRLPTTPRLSHHSIFYAGLAASIVIGSFTHQIWDAFTHKGRWGTNVVPSLNSIFKIAGYNLPGYKLCQYGSTFIGLPLLAAVTMFLLSRGPATHSTSTVVSLKLKLRILSLLCLVPPFVGFFASATQVTAYQAIGVTIKLSAAIIMSLCVAYCVAFQILSNGQSDTEQI